MLFDRNANLVGVGDKCYRIPASSRDPEIKWEVSYARQGALDIPLAPGNAIFWPAPFTRDILALEYCPLTATDSLLSSITTQGLWMNLTPRKGICMKSLAAQLGQLKKLQEVHILHAKKKDKPKGPRKLRKPHFPGQQLNKIAVDMT
ncbi:hypothetical protein PHYSODRAFT_508277 [Phytophthora sojae]|uniref:Uncharacterized protein n=1 Tax=Phytophthora sojae (strain P6497) TaxID=1094619 RepID=G4ZKH4_PHYSP|nr:hypothetical protein PHYSODRAFT_508277 [Phytophthora sojae]EGZ15916.1 hypothetical protein PHYSODRAFT_508277 [Phytophthora sojae]|eukprot:XP_009529665.1 hypothetical protein PHYSODRAFT_508277 [Phytophthora sojae]